MTPAIVQRLLAEAPRASKEVYTSDGTAVVVSNREQWIAAPDVLVVLDAKGVLHHITYWNITSIRHLPGNGKQRHRKAR